MTSCASPSSTLGTILAGIILTPWQASRIVREWVRSWKVDITCPNCGLSRHDTDASHCKACGHVIYQEYESTGPEYVAHEPYLTTVTCADAGRSGRP